MRERPASSAPSVPTTTASRSAPGKAVKVILKAVDSEKPPLHMPLGTRAYALARTKIAEFTQDIDSWEAVAKATDYE
jgi:hypothetical protein